MDKEIESIIKRTFNIEDFELVSRMLDIIERDMSNANKAKRIRDIDYLLSGGQK